MLGVRARWIPTEAKDEKADPNAYLQLMYEQNSEFDDVMRLEESPIAVPNPMVAPGPNNHPVAPGTDEQAGAGPEGMVQPE